MRLKSELYTKEQDDTIDKIVQIIGITKTSIRCRIPLNLNYLSIRYANCFGLASP